MASVVVAEHGPSVAVTVYVVLAAGLKGWLGPTKLPGIQEYTGTEPEPDAVWFEILPKHKLPEPGLTATVGVGLTVTETVVVEAVPQASVTVTV